MPTKSKQRRLTNAELEVLGIARCFQRFTDDQRANMAASHRLGYRQRQAVGDFYYTTTFAPGIAFSTQRQAARAAQAAIANA